jgi:hypothetical protein
MKLNGHAPFVRPKLFETADKKLPPMALIWILIVHRVLKFITGKAKPLVILFVLFCRRGFIKTDIIIILKFNHVFTITAQNRSKKYGSVRDLDRPPHPHDDTISVNMTSRAGRLST